MEKIWKELYEAAKACQNPRKISDYVTAGEVSAALLSKSGKIYTGVCVEQTRRNCVFAVSDLVVSFCYLLLICFFHLLNGFANPIYQVLFYCDNLCMYCSCFAPLNLLET